MTQFTISCVVQLLRLVTSDDVIVEKVINIDQNSRSQTTTESVSKLLTESVGSRCGQVANSVHTADADVLWNKLIQ